MRNPFSSETIKKGCEFNQKTGEFLCESKIIHEEGEEVIGTISGNVSESCDLAINEMWDTRKGEEIKDLTKRLQEVRGKCRKQRPLDY